ncbi:MAG: polysaccharide export protein [Elusimicrobia bacterium]|nr:polysaccharide export protein [Elusimicrobiota bacterium]
MRPFRTLAALLVLHSAVSGAWGAPAPRPEVDKNSPGLTEAMLMDKIQAGDSISISLFPGEEYSREVVVSPDGKIQMPLIGSVEVAGLSLRDLQERIRIKYSVYVDKPQVTANVRRFSGRRVAIIGEVGKAGYYDYRDGMKLLELISLAGGLSLDARPSRVVILRPSGSQREASFKVNLAAVLEGDLSRDPLLAPGDTIHVPKQPFTVSATWINRNILPWAIVTSLITSLMISTRK